MLEALFGNKNVQKILMFLFVNGKCYGTQLHRALKTPLTPLQKAFEKLENGGVIVSYYEGKTRLYQFNPAFPVLNELEQLLKKAYTLLSAHEKKNYYIAKEGHFKYQKQAAQYKVVNQFWERLSTVNQLLFTSRSKATEELGWEGNGKGEVTVTKEGSHVLIFSEKGSWRGKQGETGFTNVFRWTLDPAAGVIALEHLRRGFDHPVFLFYLAPSSTQSLESVDSHLCEGDTYFGQVFFDRYGLRLKWRVIGPKKNEEIEYYYS